MGEGALAPSVGFGFFWGLGEKEKRKRGEPNTPNPKDGGTQKRVRAVFDCCKQSILSRD